MKFLDLLKMSLGNLARRRLRTSLTVLGVIIGTTAVVTMISLGIGLDSAQLKMLEEIGSLTAVTVRLDDFSNQDSKKKQKFLNDDAIKEFENFEHIKSISPVLNANVILKQGLWEANTQLIGVSKEYMKDMKIGSGTLPDDNKELSYVIGNMIITSFQNSKTNKTYWDTNELPDIDFINKPLFTILDTEAYYQSKNPSSETSTKVLPPKKYIFKVSGLIKGGIEDYNQYAYGVYCDIDALKLQLKKAYKNKLIPGQPSTKKGKPYKFFVYDSVVVFVDDMKNVTTVQKAISDLGYQASSNMEWLEQSKQTSRMIQTFLGGIGAVSLFVAAIGIANTMMMSIYERTKEIGIMKVLGCDMNRIRDMFLIESGFIGFLGGCIGLTISFLLAIIINKLSAGFLGDIDAKLSQIPIWLAMFAIIFSTLIGMLAGFFPALRAMKLSPLAALRNE